MSEQNWIEIEGIKLNLSILAVFQGKGLEVELPMGEDYPWVLRSLSCADHLDRSCGCERKKVKIEQLHRFVWRHFNGAADPCKPGEVIHHRNEDKLDARIKNLSKGTPAAHARAHNSRRRKYSRRKAFEAGGLYRPRQPSRVVQRPELIGTTVQQPQQQKQPQRPRSLREQLLEAEALLAVKHEALQREMSHLDSGAPIPRSASTAAWKTPKTRSLGLRMPRLDPTAGEAALVMLLIKHNFSTAEVAKAIGMEEALVQEMKKRTSVAVALERWLKYRRLPTAS